MRRSAKLRWLVAILVVLGITSHPSAMSGVMAKAASDPVFITLVQSDESNEAGEAPSLETYTYNDVGEEKSESSSASLTPDLIDEIPEPVVRVLSIPEMVIEAASFYGLDVNRMLLISWCESKHGTHTIGSGHLGVFQFAHITWPWASIEAGFGIWDENRKVLHPHPNPHDPYVNIWTAAWLAKKQNYRDWPAYRPDCTVGRRN